MVIFADRLGGIAVTNLPLLYLMAAKNYPLKKFTAWSYEQPNTMDRAVGRVCVVTAIGHFGIFAYVWSPTLPGNDRLNVLAPLR
ncbi:unnamed protein product [Tuber aestivum]|uniref:Ferric oxidoreductase domain-containing protein n=1 Tax=Tuber aestivum TaxID=59557 RepID=A0A292Q7X9_9PEZI|nr:unnamed protein product [Tuber aestivum]